MKKFGMYLMMIAFVAMACVSCNSDKENPVVTIADGQDSIYVDVKNFTELTVPVIVTSADGDLISVEAFITGTDGQTYSIETINTFTTDPRAWEKIYKGSDVTLYTFIESLMKQGVFPAAFGITATAKDVDPTTATKPFKIVAAPVEHPLSDPIAFKWERIGGAQGTGLETFGLKWTGNAKEVHAQITKGTADKFVKFTSEEWKTITTLEILKVAIDAVPDLPVYDNVSAAAGKTYDDVLATKVGENYYLINVTKGTVTTGTAGTTIVIDGNYKTVK
jgi:hypothetical protein